MKIFKAVFSLFLLAVLGLALLTPAQAKVSPTTPIAIYHYHYPYFMSKDISKVQASDKVISIYIPKVSEILKGTK